MPDGLLYKFLRRFGDIRQDEARPALYLFLYFFLIALSIYLVKPVKENFLIGIKSAWWPYADFITAGLIGFVVALNTRLLRKMPRKSYFSAVAVFFALNLLIFWIVFEARMRNSAFGLPGAASLLIRNSSVPVFVFSFWTDIFIVMSVTHFWLTVNDVFNPYQARRTISLFVTGGLLGGIVGSFMTSRLVHSIGPANLLLICTVVLMLSVIIIGLVYADQKKSHEIAKTGQTKPGCLDSFRIIKEDSYLRILAALLASAMVVGTLINYQFKIAVKAAIPNDISRTSFLGSFFLGILLLSTLFHLVTTGQVLKNFGIRMGLLIAPLVLFLGSLAIFLLPAAGLMIWACFIRGSDKTFDNTLSQSVRELLYIPIPVAIKYEAKTFIDMFVNRLAVGFGAALFWILLRVPSFADKTAAAQIRQLGIFVIGFTILAIILAWSIHSEYLSTVKRDLSRKWQDAHKVVATHVDMDSARLIVDTLQSREKSSTLYAMNLFDLVQKEKLSPDLMAILSTKEGELKARAMDSLLDVGGEVIYQGIEETVADKEVETIAQEVMSLDSYELVMEKRLGDLSRNEAASELERMEAAKLVGLMKPSPGVLTCLSRLLRDSSPDVLNYALGSAAVHTRNEHVPIIIALLGNPMIRQIAQDTLTAYGPGIQDTLIAYLHNQEERLEVRSSIPEILARFADQKSADILSVELARGKDEMQQDLIDALYKIRSNQPKIHFKKKNIQVTVLALVRKCYAVYLDGFENQQPDSPSNLTQDHKPALDLEIKRIFDLLALVYPSEDIVKAYQNIVQGTRKSVDYSLELLDNVLDRDLKVFLFPVVEDLPQDEKARRLRKLIGNLERISHRVS